MKKLLILLAAALLTVGMTACRLNDNEGKGTSAETETLAEETTATETEDDATVAETETETETLTETPTETETETETQPSTVTYTVTVVDEDGNPLSGATVQFCKGDLCFLPTTTLENGVATYVKEPDAYDVKVILKGYVGEAKYNFEGDATSMTVTLTREPLPLDELLHNVFDTKTVRNETVMFIDYGDEKTLLYPIGEILSVTSYDGKTTYVEGKDYEVRDGKLVILEGSDMPCITSAVYYKGDGTIIADGKKLYWGEEDTMTRWQVCVSYTHDAGWDGYQQTCFADRYEKFIGKLERGEDVTVYFYGDSITAGANASYFIGVEPYQNAYTVLFLQALAETFDYTVKFEDVTPGNPISDKIPTQDLVCGTRGTITYLNSAIGGWNTQQGLNGMSSVVANMKTYGCDLFVLAFGMNDGAAQASSVASLQEQIMARVTKAMPDVSLMIVSTMVPHTGSNWYGSQAIQMRPLNDLANKLNEAGTPCALANMTSVSLAIYQQKDFEDCTGNNINHPNDFLGRVYAQTLFQTLIGYENVRDYAAAVAEEN